MIKIKNEHLNEIRSHGESAYNEECCGAILGISNGDERIVQGLLKFNNEFVSGKEETRARRYLISPKQYIESEAAAEERNMELLGFYHSHPDHPAKPSEFDKDHALPWFIYLIVSVAKGKSENLTAWILNEDHSSFKKEIFEIIK
jgi:proteasome lid subunit RPN8/RPN11